MNWARFLSGTWPAAIAWATRVGLAAYYGGKAAAERDPAVRDLRLRALSPRLLVVAYLALHYGKRWLERSTGEETRGARGTHVGHARCDRPRARRARPDRGPRSAGRCDGRAGGRRLGWTPERIAVLRHAAPIHDVGKLVVRAEVLRKPGPLSDEERAEMRAHPRAGAALVLPLPNARHILPYVLLHHERWDGYGYPCRLRGTTIPLEAQTARGRGRLRRDDLVRPYRAARMPGDAFAELGRCAGTPVRSTHRRDVPRRSGRPRQLPLAVCELDAAQTSSFWRTREITSSVNSLVPSSPPRSDVRTPEATASRQASRIGAARALTRVASV